MRRITRKRPNVIDPELHLGLLYIMAAKYARKWRLNRDELVGEGYLGLKRACECFRPELGFQFSKYAAKAIWSALLHYRDQIMLQQRRKRLRHGVEMPEPLGDASWYVPDRETINSGRWGALRRLEALVDECPELTDVQRAVILLRGRGWTLEATGQAVGLGKERVRQVQNKVISILRTAAEEEEIAA